MVFDNGGFGNVKRIQQMAFNNRTIASDLHNPDFVKLGESFGIAAERARSPEELGTAVTRALSRGGPIVWLSEADAQQAGIEDNDWIELYNVNGAIAARAVVSQRVNPGMCMMYHAQEKIVNTPGSEITGTRGGIHNSVTRIVLKPTHMIGGYAQLSYGFNYYGTIGTNRDEFVVVRKMQKVDWLGTPRDDHLVKAYQSQGENP